MAKKKGDNKPKDKFPTNDRDYYYYYEIFQLKQLKKYYNSINQLILSDCLENSPLNNYSANNDYFSNIEIYNEYKRYYDDFNFYIDKLINKDGINNNVDFQNIIEYLMVNVSHSNQFINRYLIFKGNKKFYNQKINYMGKKRTVKNILSENQNIIYKLNPDYIPLIVSNYSIPILLFIIWLVFLFIFVATHHILGFILLVAYSIGYLCLIPTFNYVNKQNSVYISKYKYVAHPFSQKIKLKDIILTLSLIKDFIKEG